ASTANCRPPSSSSRTIPNSRRVQIANSICGTGSCGGEGMLIDTHCHLDANEFAHDREAVIRDAAEAGVRSIVIPAIAPSNFRTVRDLAHTMPGAAYALGIHPLLVSEVDDSALDGLR